MHLELFADVPAAWRNEALDAKWEKVHRLRRVVLGALEEVRVAKRIGSSLEAKAVLFLSDPELVAALEGVDMAEVAITSGFERRPYALAPENAFRLPNEKDVAVAIAPVAGRKCARSWRYSEEVGTDPDYPDVTLRDAAALREYDAAHQAAVSMAGRAQIAGVAAAILGVLIDQAHKLWMLGPFDIEERGRVALTPFLDLVLVWNKGISYGLLTQDGHVGRWLLTALGIAGAALFGWWLRGARSTLAGTSLGLVMAGAISNVIDRLVHGAVADFFLFHVGGFEWYVFNLADVWIVAGVIGLVLAWASERPEIATET